MYVIVTRDSRGWYQDGDHFDVSASGILTIYKGDRDVAAFATDDWLRLMSDIDPKSLFVGSPKVEEATLAVNP
jgi:hypothetical protein